MALSVWGLDAGGGPYAAITALTNIPATLLAAVFYEAVFADYTRSACLCAYLCQPHTEGYTRANVICSRDSRQRRLLGCTSRAGTIRAGSADGRQNRKRVDGEGGRRDPGASLRRKF